MTGWRSHSNLEEAQVQENDLLIPERSLRPEKPPSLSRDGHLAAESEAAFEGQAQGGFLGRGLSLDQEIDSLGHLGTFLPLVSTRRGEWLRWGQDVRLVPMLKGHRCCPIWGVEVEGSRGQGRRSAG